MLNSCDNYTSRNITYQGILKQAPEFLVNHFPKEINENPLYLYVGTDERNQRKDYTFFLINCDTVKSYIKTLDKISIGKYTSSDMNLIIIKNSLDIELGRYKNIDSLKQNNIFYYPIPFIDTLYDLDKEDRLKIFSSTQSGLSKNFTIYVLDSKPGIYWNGLKELSYMPNGWKNGYSTGVSINERERIVIYWFVVW